ncbi:MAG: hypothetical protein Kow002_04390 [Anaerolineales bacterium]
MKTTHLLAWAVFLATILSACGLVEPAATPVVTTNNAPQDGGGQEALTATPPLRFDLPTPGAEPVSGWRPPLYPIPWSVSPYDHFYFARPIAADNVNWPLAEYRYGGIFFADVVHTGVDIPTDKGTPILATGAGTVIWADWGLFTGVQGLRDDPYGKAVAIKHDFGYRGQPLYTLYAHMEAINASVGQWVKAGEVIGYVGDTGETTGPHLHFEVRLGQNSFHHTYNPELWMAPPQGWGVLVGRVSDQNGKLLNFYRVEVRPVPDEKPLRVVRTYAGGATNPDPYYNENMVLSDLPAGVYNIRIEFERKDQQFWVEIFPGQVTYFTFRGKDGFHAGLPPTPSFNFLPVTATPTSTPIPTFTPR